MKPESTDPIYPLTHELPTNLVTTEDEIHLTASRWSGCNPVAYIFFVVILFLIRTGLTMTSFPIDAQLFFWGGMVLPMIAMACWLLSRHTHYILDRKSIRKMCGLRRQVKDEWSTEGIHAVEMVPQYYGGRYAQFTPGLHLLRGRTRINLGAKGRPEQAMAIGKTIADFYGVPFSNQTAGTDFGAFRRGRIWIFLTGLLIAGAFIVYDIYSK